MTGSRRTVAASALAVVALYVASALLSGHLSVLARRPLLDGTTPPVPYKWVDPPKALAGTNVRPTSGSFQVQLNASGSKTAVLTTDDAQVTLILAKGAFAPVPGETYVQVSLTPLAAKAVTPPKPPLQIVGNVIKVEATYQPSGKPAPIQSATARIVLVYPLLVNVHAHTIVSSTDGTTWTTPQTNDLPSIQQADALISGAGYAAVASTPAAATSSSASGGTGGSGTATILIVAALVVLATAAIVVMRRGASGRAGAPIASPSRRKLTPEERRRRDERRRREERRGKGDDG